MGEGHLSAALPGTEEGVTSGSQPLTRAPSCSRDGGASAAGRAVWGQKPTSGPAFVAAGLEGVWASLAPLQTVGLWQAGLGVGVWDADAWAAGGGLPGTPSLPPPLSSRAGSCRFPAFLISLVPPPQPHKRPCHGKACGGVDRKSLGGGQAKGRQIKAGGCPRGGQAPGTEHGHGAQRSAGGASAQAGSSAREVPPLCQQRLPQGEERCPRGLAGREAWGAPDRHWAHLVVTLSRASQPGCQQWSLGAATGLGQDSTPHGASAAPPPPRPPPNRKVPGFLAGLARAQQPGAVGLLRAGREGAADSEARRGPAGVSGWVFSWPRVEGQEGIIRTWGSRGPTSLTATGRGRRRG
ncbi:uncharacterized protein LOC123384670 [Felis catus]|uniref:uncharacterized protein LOC123384670 n=1 Tax=Felis catus TaxID=9685 RepID=UPI001D19F8E7|nr:uncharacterized protein LOC123384670 [Felis catus]